MTDPSRMRVSDADRHKVAEVLREAAGEGRLDMAELDERLDATYAAKVYDDLLPIVADLPGAGSAVPQNQLTVLNRWGNEVYKARAYTGGWDGDNLSEGTYFYIASVKMCDGGERVFKGFVTIVR